MRPVKWISILLVTALLLQPLACAKRVPVAEIGRDRAAHPEEILYVTLQDGSIYELLEWEVGPEYVTGKREMIRVTMLPDGTVTEEEYLDPVRFKLDEVASLDLEKLDRRSLWVVGAIAGGVAGAFAAIASLSGSGGSDSGASGGGIGSK